MKGLNNMLSLIKRIGQRFPDRVAAALYAEAQLMMTESKRRCPVAPDGGTLRASGKVHDPERGIGRHISVTMSYGGAAQDYAIAVHEHPSEHSPYSWRIHAERGLPIDWNADGTGPKFLEGPINEVMPTLARRIAERVHLERER